MNSPWHTSNHLLRYQISDKTIAAKRLRLLARDIDVVSEAEANQTPWLSKNEPLPSDLDGYMALGFPVDQKQKTIAFQNQYIVYVASSYQRFYIRFDSSFDQYLSQFSSKTRSTLKRKIKKFSQHAGGTIDFRIYRTPTELKEFFQLARTVSSKTYQESLLDAGLPESQEFYQQMLGMGQTDDIRAYLLFYQDNPIAYLYLTASNDALLYKYLGYDPKYAQWSVGTVLHWLAIEKLFEESKFKYLDFTQGDGQQKKTFSNGSKPCVNLFVLRKTLGNLLLVSLHISINQLSSTLGKLLDKFGLKSKMKKILRFGVNSNA